MNNKVRNTAALLLVTACMLMANNQNANGHTGLVRTTTAQTLGGARMNIGTGIGYATDNVSATSRSFVTPLDQNTNNADIADSKPPGLLSTNAFLAFGIAPFMDLAAMIPFYYDWSGLGTDEGWIGDLEISAKLLYPPPAADGRLFYQAYLFSLAIPTGRNESGIFPRHFHYLKFIPDGENPELYGTSSARTYYSSGSFAFKPMMLWTLDFGSLNEKTPILLHGNFGGLLSKQHLLLGNIALEGRPTEFMALFVELAAEIRGSRFNNLDEMLNMHRDPLWLTPGIQITTPSGFHLTLAGDFGISTHNTDRFYYNKGNLKYKTGVVPRWGVNFSLGWTGFLTMQDGDRDGIKNDIDRCPRDAEDIDGFEDADGCPDPDNDKDGIPDDKDKCPDEAEDKDGFEDEDGCPDIDNDKDGIKDLQDQCPNQPEDHDGLNDRDGCPDNDNDKDGVVDSLDKCPNDPEDFDNFQDDDGCPDIDNDKDGIKDLTDKCPNKPETFNGYRDEDGCPDKKKKKKPGIPKEQVLRGITFKSGSAEMTFGSYQYLEPIIKQLKEFPEIEIEIRGHTDAIGNLSYNMRLSQMRAESVRQYLIAQGISSARIRAVGFGPNRPIANNQTASGRAQNRRIEIVRIK